MCWEQCKSNYEDHGVTCFRNTHVYSKGCCCTIFSLDCCNSCNSTYIDDGCTCRRNLEVYIKKSYFRSLGLPMGCTKDQEQNGLLCYPNCQNGYIGNGPVCWLGCNSSLPFDCGLFCAKDASDCSAANRLMLKPIKAVIWFVNNKCNSKYLKKFNYEFKSFNTV